jgi:hypothetical protein
MSDSNASNESNAVTFAITSITQDHTSSTDNQVSNCDDHSSNRDDQVSNCDNQVSNHNDQVSEQLDITSSVVNAQIADQMLPHRVFENGSWTEKPASSDLTAVIATLSHHVFESGNWVKKPAPSHPTVTLTAHTDESDYTQFGFSNPNVKNVNLQAIVDSGAQCCVWGWKDCNRAGFTYKHLIPVKQKLNAVSKSAVRIHGAVILRMSGTSLASSANKPCAAIVYVSPDVSGFYLSNEAMKQLLIVPHNFPSVGKDMKIDSLQKEHPDDECSCPKRTLPPGPPKQLPFEPIPENIGKMKEYLLDRYASSTFNKCPHHPIPVIPGPPISIHVDPDATPVRCNTPSQVPLHYLEKVEKGLKQDEAMGVISKVPHDVPTKWCHRMVVRQKGDGELRRTVDLSPLNKHTMREVHAMQSPFN